MKSCCNKTSAPHSESSIVEGRKKGVIATFKTEGNSSLVLDSCKIGYMVKIGQLCSPDGEVSIVDNWLLKIADSGNFTIKIRVQNTQENIRFSLVEFRNNNATSLSEGTTGCGSCVELEVTKNLRAGSTIGVIIEGKPCIEKIKLRGFIQVNSWKQESCNSCESQKVAIIYSAGVSESNSEGESIDQESLDILERSLSSGLFCGISDIKLYPYFTGEPESDNPEDVAAWIREIVLKIEQAVIDAYNQGIRIALISGISVWVEPWITGEIVIEDDEGNVVYTEVIFGTADNPLNIAEREITSKMIFVLVGLRAALAARELALPNAFSTADLVIDPELIVASVDASTTVPGSIAPGVGVTPNSIPPGQFLPVVQEGDKASIETMQQWIDALKAAGIEVIEPPIALTYSGGVFTNIDELVTAVAGLPDRSMVGLAVNGSPEFQDALTDALNNSGLTGLINLDANPPATIGNVTYLGVNYIPVSRPLDNIDLYLGLTSNVLQNIPPVLVERLSLPVDPSETGTILATTIPLLIGLGMANASIIRCPFTGFDSTARFDVFGGFINPLIASTIVPHETFDLLTYNVAINPRWQQAIPLPPPVYPSDICECAGSCTSCSTCQKC